MKHGAWRSQAKAVGAQTLWRAYTAARLDAPKSLLFVDRAAPACTPSLLITMDAPANEPPGNAPPATTSVRIDEGPALALPMKLEASGAQLVWSSDSGVQAGRVAGEMARGRFLAVELARGPGMAPLRSRYPLNGFAEADARMKAQCEARKAKGKP